MVRIILANAFSLSMVKEKEIALGIKEISVERVKEILEEARKRKIEIVSAIGHGSTAKVISKMLGFEVPVNRIMITLDDDTLLIVFQVMKRLPPATELNEEEIEKLLKEGKIKTFIVFSGWARGDGWNFWLYPKNEVIDRMLREDSTIMW